MSPIKSLKALLSRPTGRVALMVVSISTLSVSPAFAQLTKLTSVMQNVQTALLGIGVVAFTIAIAWAGYKMIFQHAKWSEISNIVIGGVLVGGAAEIAGWLIN
ncbi:TrbC/VirB2 family protein [Asticcacaulis sp. EMRT-3]|uniref:TrbC/VirB2 family protein n=1 Tax=Asticcacaulis sp. EMRT-3 TaxID=3040349 RepID=UPI0024AF6AB6|nr:TrbC/VirB2 family protein [Asticcacaulis sp. EMRT-3]MDI7776578.1 TrbC/VirB2 family protein [Asticcacaulis sp. EMRT-3]